MQAHYSNNGNVIECGVCYNGVLYTRKEYNEIIMQEKLIEALDKLAQVFDKNLSALESLGSIIDNLG